jgi:hypothetical protein
MFKRLAVRAGISLLGTVIVLVWWTYHGHNPHSESSNTIPATVWGGGGAKITVEAEASTAATISIDFNERGKSDGEPKMLQTWEKFAPGTKSWTVDAPAKVGGYIQLQADLPKPGDKLKWRVTINGEQVGQDEFTLEKPLQNNEAMFLQLHFEDYANASNEIKDEQ